jgi:hypothetical protein
MQTYNKGFASQTHILNHDDQHLLNFTLNLSPCSTERVLLCTELWPKQGVGRTCLSLMQKQLEGAEHLLKPLIFGEIIFRYDYF